MPVHSFTRCATVSREVGAPAAPISNPCDSLPSPIGRSKVASARPPRQRNGVLHAPCDRGMTGGLVAAGDRCGHAFSGGRAVVDRDFLSALQPRRRGQRAQTLLPERVDRHRRGLIDHRAAPRRPGDLDPHAQPPGFLNEIQGRSRSEMPFLLLDGIQRRLDRARHPALAAGGPGQLFLLYYGAMIRAADRACRGALHARFQAQPARRQPALDAFEHALHQQAPALRRGPRLRGSGRCRRAGCR